jgi:protein kinase C substrate 80K-H
MQRRVTALALVALSSLLLLMTLPAAAALRCRGGREIPDEWVNDGYCDCEGDEALTGACPGTPFLCRNEGHSHQHVPIPAAHVHDGVCDCCDGSDEPASLCANRCGREAWEEAQALERQLAALRAGLRARKALVDEGAASMDLLQRRLYQVTRQAQGLSQRLQEWSAAVDSPEEHEAWQFAAHQMRALNYARARLESFLNEPQSSFGAELQYAHLIERCFALPYEVRKYGAFDETFTGNMQVDRYVMELCPFENATQYREEAYAHRFELSRENRANMFVLGSFHGWSNTTASERVLAQIAGRPLPDDSKGIDEGEAEEGVERAGRRRRQQRPDAEEEEGEMQRQGHDEDADESDRIREQGRNERQRRQRKPRAKKSKKRKSRRAEDYDEDENGDDDGGASEENDDGAYGGGDEDASRAARQRESEDEAEEQVEAGRAVATDARRPGDPNDFLFYAGGDPCWQGPPRSARVRTVCAERDALAQAREVSKCTYEFTLATPAACTREEVSRLSKALKRARSAASKMGCDASGRCDLGPEA